MVVRVKRLFDRGWAWLSRRAEARSVTRRAGSRVPGGPDRCRHVVSVTGVSTHQLGKVRSGLPKI